MTKPTQNARLRFPAWRLPKGTKNASSDELEKASSSCESWEIGCAGVVVAAVCAEFAIAGIHPPYDSFLEQWGSAAANAFVALGIVGEVIFSGKDARIQTELRDRSNTELAEAKRELARISTPRVKLMTDEALTSIKSAVKPFAGTPFDVGHAKFDREVWDFLWRLEPALTEAGWKHVSWLGGYSFRKNGWPGNHEYGEANVSKVSLEMHPTTRSMLLPAAEALAAALRAIGIDTNTSDNNNLSQNPTAIHLLVGPTL